MHWMAVVPIKPPAARKTRLNMVNPHDKLVLTETMLDHVLAVLGNHPAISTVALLSAIPRAGFDWIADQGQGLNSELERIRQAEAADILILFPDLPLVNTEDISALLAFARRNGAAIAPDRHRMGTNALALQKGVDFILQFGRDSRFNHAAQLSSTEAVVERPGLAFDLDTPEDLHMFMVDHGGRTGTFGCHVKNSRWTYQS